MKAHIFVLVCVLSLSSFAQLRSINDIRLPKNSNGLSNSGIQFNRRETINLKAGMNPLSLSDMPVLNYFKPAQDTNAIRYSIQYGYVTLGGAPMNFSKTVQSATNSLDFNYSEMNAIYSLKPILIRTLIQRKKMNYIGVDILFNSLASSGFIVDSIWNNSTNSYDIEKKDTYYRMHRLRIQVRFERHFKLGNPKLDPYMGCGIGASHKFRKYTENGVRSNFQNAGIFSLNFPLSLRFSGGMGYYISENIGINAEIGIGGPLLSFGITGKL